jgi:anti-anti-sigma factor
MEVRTEVVDGVAVLQVIGRIDFSTRSILESAIQSSISDGHARIILDMRKLTFISSVGLRLISMTAKQATIAQGGLAIFGLRSDLNEVFEICGMKDIVSIASAETEARSMLGA